jgi:hypothetical protein
MRAFKFWSVALVLLVAATALAQDWRRSYEQGLEYARAEQWAQARTAFQAAAAARSDQNDPIALPGPPTQRRHWRDGAAYSPNFLAAYAAYRVALESSGDAQRPLLEEAAREFEALMEHGQRSRETVYFLNLIYSRLSDTPKVAALSEAPIAYNWRIDREVLAPVELAEIPSPAGNARSMKMVRAGEEGAVATPGTVGIVPTKYALIIGNSGDDGRGLPYAASDAERMRDVLALNAGYGLDQVVLLQNATKDEMLAAATELAERLRDESTVFLYFAGTGTNIGGRDFLVGTDSSVHSAETMLAKGDLLQPLISRGARIFTFYQVNRPLEHGSYFGRERPALGAVSQMQATAPGSSVLSTVREGQPAGIFTEAMAGVLGEMRSNRIPIQEFGWQVFYRMKGGEAGGGGSQQTPTLPMLTNLASDSRF